MNVFDKCYIGMKNWILREKESFLSDERGVSGMVAAIILLMVTLILAAVFWEKINGMVGTWWDKITENQDKIGT